MIEMNFSFDEFSQPLCRKEIGIRVGELFVSGRSRPGIETGDDRSDRWKVIIGPIPYRQLQFSTRGSTWTKGPSMETLWLCLC